MATKSKKVTASKAAKVTNKVEFIIATKSVVEDMKMHLSTVLSRLDGVLSVLNHIAEKEAAKKSATASKPQHGAKKPSKATAAKKSRKR